MEVHPGYVPGCIGRIAELHANYYSRSVGFGLAFEAKVASELADFCLRRVDGRDGLWLGLHDGVIHGSIAIDGSHYDECGAHLRWFITSDACRGRGLGKRLIGAAMAFCRERNYRRIYLWTFDELRVARHLYERHGFALARTERGKRWGKEVNEQLFVIGEAGDAGAGA